ncbi:hypothetical protein [Aquabacter sediminis]|uniref:hypothetical protein n=1 Tax=Aquabacter sediminis TaxID=3029197 RepID=UPI00237D84D9|nr:hypothetical protein [Aquabacter sp. P-9]MDE1570217.1 hypothetical protein [Aquabacter sp. P-9]
MTEALCAPAEDAKTHGMDLLDRIERAFIAGGDPAVLMKELSFGLTSIRDQASVMAWRRSIRMVRGRSRLGVP